MAQPKLSEQHNVQVPIVEALLIQCLSLLQVNNLAKIQDSLDHIKIELAEDGMVVVQAQVADVDLHFLISGSLATFSFAELFADLKEALFDFSFDAGLELLFHVVELEVLPFEILEWIALLIMLLALHVLHDRFLSIRGRIKMVPCHVVKHAVAL